MFDPARSQKKLAELEEKTADPNLWDDQTRAQQLLQEKTTLEKSLKDFLGFEQEFKDSLDLMELGEEENDQETIVEAQENLKDLQKRAAKKSLECLLSGEADGNNAYLEINAGAGGTEAQDWANMLLRMYLRWAESKKCKIEYIEESKGEEAGIKSTTIKISGQNAYGWLKTESGVHRLVRISPYDSSARRHTSFASIWVYPEIDDNIDMEIEEKDLRIDTYRASGAGGQHVNTTDSAVRITHVPTNIVVQCQQDRSQHRNRAMALDMLRARLYEMELQRREEAAMEENATKSEIGWGHQIRSYVLHPYQMVKDLRTSVETGNTQSVLDGGIDLFLEASLANKISKKSED
jgi:peptide chain release factor 2